MPGSHLSLAGDAGGVRVDRALVERQVQVLGKDQAAALKKVRKCEVDIVNLLDEKSAIEAELAVETGVLMQVLGGLGAHA